MSYSPPNYTDGVPIKISEKYKPPPAVHLPTRIIQKLAKTEVPVAFEDYNFDLEHKIISKTSEWMQWRAREKSERQERIRQRELARLKQLEDEQKQKLNQVSYPSTDDEDEELANEAANPHADHQHIIPKEETFSPTNFSTILMPTQALQDPIHAKKSHRRYASNSSNKIDFSFFESDTSPFDHLEMKSMNEMELLAQVLGTSAGTRKDLSEANKSERNSSSESESSDHQKNNNNVVQPQPEVEQNQQPQYQQNYVPQMYTNYYGMRGTNSAYGAYSYGASAVTATKTSVSFSQVNPQNQFLYPQNYAVNYGFDRYHAMVNNNNTIVNGTSEKIDPDSKSKSVPSILKELNDELNNSERRRIRNNSQNSPKEIPQQAKPSPVDDDFSKLSLKTQTLATQISQMGFQREMVIRALARIGNDDKKIVEHLIPLNELLQMGFEEERVSEALIKFDNNKDRALDYLIS